MFHAVTTHLGIDLQETGGGGGRLCRHTCLTVGFELHKVKNIRTHNNRLQTKNRATISNSLFCLFSYPYDSYYSAKFPSFGTLGHDEPPHTIEIVYQRFKDVLEMCFC